MERIIVISIALLAVLAVTVWVFLSPAIFGLSINANSLFNSNTVAKAASTCGTGSVGGGCGGGTNTGGIGAGTVQTANISAGSEYQEINMTVDNGWLPGSFIVKTGVPVRWNVYVKQFGGCINGLSAPDLGINYRFQQFGETKIFEFTPTKAGTIYFTCLMGMARGQIEVRDDVTVSDAAATNAAAAKNPAKKTGGCGCGGGSGRSCGG